MVINITNKTTIADVQQRMRTTYPFLKIEFSHNPRNLEEKPHKDRLYDHEARLFEIAKKAKPGWVVINPGQKSDHITNVFESRFGLHAQIFRRMNDGWIEISGTDILTIEDQNEIGRRSVERTHEPSWREREFLL